MPFNFRLMAEAPAGADLSSLRLCFSAGTALPRASFEAFGERFGVLVRQLYGSTETGMIAANLSDDPVVDVRVRRPAVQGVEIEIVDDDGAPVPSGEIGEVTVAQPRGQPRLRRRRRGSTQCLPRRAASSPATSAASTRTACSTSRAARSC